MTMKRAIAVSATVLSVSITTTEAFKSFERIGVRTPSIIRMSDNSDIFGSSSELSLEEVTF